jgi:hypothetical protein
MGSSGTGVNPVKDLRASTKVGKSAREILRSLTAAQDDDIKISMTK